MDLASFKLRYPSFINDNEILIALSDAELYVSMYNIDTDKIELATALMAAHLLTLMPENGTTEQVVKKVKADTVEVEFSEKGGAQNGWLSLTSYGRQFELLTRASMRTSVYGVVNDGDLTAIRFEGWDEDDKEFSDKALIQSLR